MTISTDALTSDRVEVDGSIDDAIELCYQRGWTDGLPVTPPTPRKVLDFLEFVGRQPSDVIGIEPIRGRVITAEKVAINAVMAGCRPEYMPVVIACVEAMVEPKYNLHGSSASTGGSAPLVVINGPVRQKLGFASGHNIFGPGPDRRANATVGRAMRLILINVLENHPGVLDKSTMGHPGKYTYCIAEDEENSPWEPMHVELGYPPESSTVSVFTSLAPWQINVAGDAGTPEAILTAAATAMRGLGPGQGNLILVISQEHGGIIKEAGWSKEQVRAFLFEKARRTAREWAETGQTLAPEPGAEDETIPVCLEPDSLTLLAGGGPAGANDSLVPRWAKGLNGLFATKEIDTSRIP